MSSLHEKRSHKKGLPPGTISFPEKNESNPTTIEVISYNQAELHEYEDFQASQLLALWNKEGTTDWINIYGLSGKAEIEHTGELFHLHPLLLEDIVSTHQRPKLDEYDNCLYVVCRMLGIESETHQITSEQVSMVLLSDTLLVFQEDEGDVFDNVRERLRKQKGRTRKNGADFLLYSLLDTIVDNYFFVLEEIGERIEELEEELLEKPDSDTLQSIHALKREMLKIKKSVWPLRDVVNQMLRGENNRITDETRFFIKDLYDHVVQVIDTTETYRDLLASMTEIYLNSVSNRMNEVMKVLTVIATIFIPLTFIAGVYGMNFKHMPELDWKWGYPFALGIMGLLAIGMLYFFYKKGWLRSSRG